MPQVVLVVLAAQGFVGFAQLLQWVLRDWAKELGMEPRRLWVRPLTSRLAACCLLSGGSQRHVPGQGWIIVMGGQGVIAALAAPHAAAGQGDLTFTMVLVAAFGVLSVLRGMCRCSPSSRFCVDTALTSVRSDATSDDSMMADGASLETEELVDGAVRP